MKSFRPIFLIGYMACGKTTLGRAIRDAMPSWIYFVDLDEAVEERAGMSVKEIFATRGEEVFRRMESDEIRHICTISSGVGGRMIVACGGGTPCRKENLDLIRERGTVIWLKANEERTLSRLIEFQDSRPLLAGMDADTLKDFVARNLAERTPYYSCAHAVFDSSYLDTPDEIARTVKRFTDEFLSLPKNTQPWNHPLR